MRNHGWELPYHPLQVISIAVFVALAFAFYVFFVPFVGNRILEFHVIAVYSPVVFTVFVLYVKCAATNPADPGVLRSRKRPSASNAKLFTRNSEGDARSTQQAAETPQLSPSQEGSEKVQESEKHHKCSSALPYVACFRKLLSRPTRREFVSDSDLLYCSLCEVEIIKSSKHCRVCDKCVDCFDHHCRWLNNCIGKRNYRCFIALMISSISMLVLQSSVGIWVLTRCFLFRRLCLDDIVSKLGSSFSFVPYIVVVGSCTVLAIVAVLPLGQLFCFHVLLIKKGISTYDYILAMREQDQLKSTFEVNQTPATSPASSIATAASGASSMGGLPRGSWCTPPHLFLPHQQAVLEPGIAFPSRELELGEAKKVLPAQEQAERKPAVKINPWALARLNREDALRATARARNNSSIMRHVAASKEGVLVSETDSGIDSSSRDVSAEIHAPQLSGVISVKAGASLSPLRERFRLMKSWGHEKLPVESLVNADVGSVIVNMEEQVKKGGNRGLNLLKMEAQAGLCHAGTEIMSSGSSSTSPEAQSLSEDLLRASAAHPTNQSSFQRCTNDGYEASGGESADDSDRGGRTSQFPWSKLIFYGNRIEINRSDVSRATGSHEDSALSVRSSPLERRHAPTVESKVLGQAHPAPVAQKREKISGTSHVGCSEFVASMESGSMRRPSLPTSHRAFPSGATSMTNTLFSPGH